MAVRTVAVGPKAAGGGASSGRFVARCLLPGDLETASDVLDHWYSFAGAAVLARWHIQAKGSAPASRVVLDVLVSTDGGTSWASIFPEGNDNKIVLPAGQLEAAGTAFATSTFTTDHKLRVDVLEASGADYEFYLSGSWA
jgi:hypothetical protein